MKHAARLKDNHFGSCNHGQECCPHFVSGSITGGCDTVIIEGKNAVVSGDLVQSNCPHCGLGEVIQGSSTVFIEGKPKARTQDRVTYSAGSGEIADNDCTVMVGD